MWIWRRPWKAPGTVADLTTYEILDPEQAQKAYAELVGTSAP